MSKVDESSWVTLSITFTPDDIMEIEDAIADLHLHWDAIRTKSGILEHIVEQYKAKYTEKMGILKKHEELHATMKQEYAHLWVKP
jgi:hypothetical protein